MGQMSLLGSIGAHPLLSGLNPSQREAVTALNGPVLVVAAPGSGKTTVLTNRIAYMVEQGISPDAILAVTFTKKAAGEMAERVAKKVGSKAIAERLRIGTFHSICLKLLEGNYKKLGYPTDKPHLATGSTQRAIFELIAREHDFRDIRYEELAFFISRAKSMLLTPRTIRQSSSDPDEMRYGQLFGAYQARMVKQNLIDFDDQLGLAVRLLEEDAEIREAFRAQTTHVLVDEYQDTNRAQYALLRLMAEPRANLFAVGDDAQGIYGFRAADLNNILNFRKDFAGTKEILLESNYRSTPRIVALANALIKHNQGQIVKTIKAERPAAPDDVLVTQYGDNFSEAEGVAEEIVQRMREGVIPDEIAILYRTHAQAMPLMDALTQRDIPFTVKKSDSFYEQPLIAETLGFMRLARRGRHPLADLAMEKLLLKLGLNREALSMLKAHAEREQTDFVSACHEVEAIPMPTLSMKGLVKHVLGMVNGWRRFPGSPAELYLKIIADAKVRAKLEAKGKEIKNAERLDALSAMHEQIKRWNCASVDEVFRRIEAVTNPQKPKDRKAGSVQMLTVHGAKGLEWDVVFVLGLEEGVLPYQNALDEGELSEERRLAYVAITRARRWLRMSYGRERSRFGQAKPATPSRFLQEMKAPPTRDLAPPPPEPVSTDPDAS